MANVLLLPGFGGQYSASIAGGGTGSDKIDCTRAAELVFQATGKTGDSTTITVEESWDGGTTWGSLTTFSSTTGTIKKLAFSSGPFGLIRLSADGATGVNPVTVTGLPLAIGV